MIKRIFEQCRGCLGEGTIEETHPCPCNNMADKPADFKCEICQNVGLVKSKTMCNICKGKGKIDITGPRKVDISCYHSVMIIDDNKTRIWCPYQNEVECLSRCACFSIKLSQDNRHYYAVCSHHSPDFIIGEVEIEEQMSESK